MQMLGEVPEGSGGFRKVPVLISDEAPEVSGADV